MGSRAARLASLACGPWRVGARVAALVVGLAGCGDRCETLCDDVSDVIATCRTDALSWADVGATGRRDFAVRCKRGWDDTSSALSARDLELALDVCEDGQTELETLTCDEIVALYAPQ